MANTSVAITAGSGTSIASFADANSLQFQRVLSAPDGSQYTTYRAAVSALAVTAAATTDIFQIIGAANKLVRITSLKISGTIATTAVFVDYQLFKRSAAASGGTAATLTAVPVDSASSAAAAVATTFTSTGPTVGTAVGQIAAQRVFLPITGTPTASTVVTLIGAQGPAQSVTLRTAAEALCINCNTVTFGTAPLFSIEIEWTEVAA